MNIQFSAVNLYSKETIGKFLHAKVGLTDNDRLPFSEAKDAFKDIPSKKEAAKASLNSEEWKLTLGIDQSNADHPVRCLPGHPNTNKNSFEGGWSTVSVWPENIQPVLKALK